MKNAIKSPLFAIIREFAEINRLFLEFQIASTESELEMQTGNLEAQAAGSVELPTAEAANEESIRKLYRLSCLRKELHLSQDLSSLLLKPF